MPHERTAGNRHRDRRQRLLRPRDGRRLQARGARRLRRSSSARATSAAPGATTRTRAAPATSRATSTRSRSRPTRTGARPFSPPAGDPRLPARASPTTTACSPHVRFNCEVESARWDDEAAALARSRRRDGPLTRARADRRRRARCTSRRCPTSRASPSSRARSSTPPRWDHDHDLDGRARRRDRHRRLARSSSCPQIQPKVAQLHLFQRTPPWVMPRRDRADPAARAARSTGALPALQRAGARRRSTGRARRSRSRCCVAPAAACARSSGRGGTCAAQIADPELRAKLTPDYLLGCKRILVSNDYLPALGKPNVEVVTDGIARGPRALDRRRPTGSSARSTRSSSAPASTSPTCRSPSASAAATARTLAERWDGSPQAHRGTHGRRASRTCSCCSGRTPASATPRWSTWPRSQVDYVLRRARRTCARAAPRRRGRPEAAAALRTTTIAARMQGTVWTTGGCASWYLDAHRPQLDAVAGLQLAASPPLRRFEPAEHTAASEEPAPAEVAA